ncbi:hypothetical protein ACKKBG_A29860 [Auxenochlorella protothecoides x Auxenochlorella symbiontica]
MALTLESLRPADFAVLGVLAVTLLACLLAAAFVIPWRPRSRKLPQHRMANRFWQARFILELLIIVWMATQTLRLSSVWGYSSIVFQDDVTDWSGAGRNCRVYLTVALGVLQPLCCLTALLAFAAVTRLPEDRESLGGWRASGSLIFTALLLTIPIGLCQAVIAWLSTFVTLPGGVELEAQPTSLLGYFFAAFAVGGRQACGGEAGCTLCTFPAAAVIVHLTWRTAFLLVLWLRARRARREARDDPHLAVRVRAFQWALSLLVVGECTAAGVSIAFNPFTWGNQACWLAFFACLVAQVWLLGWAVVTRPLHDAHALNKRVAFWNAAAEAGGPPPSPEGRLIRAWAQRSDGGGGGQPSPFGPVTHSAPPRPLSSSLSHASATLGSGDSMRSLPSFAAEPPPRMYRT